MSGMKVTIVGGAGGVGASRPSISSCCVAATRSSSSTAARDDRIPRARPRAGARALARLQRSRRRSGRRWRRGRRRAALGDTAHRRDLAARVPGEECVDRRRARRSAPARLGRRGRRRHEPRRSARDAAAAADRRRRRRILGYTINDSLRLRTGLARRSACRRGASRRG